MAEIEWKVIPDKLAAFEPLIRLMNGRGWTLHSWNMFEVTEGGGRIANYLEPMVCTVWTRGVGAEVGKDGG